jgi:hypothetical protein
MAFTSLPFLCCGFSVQKWLMHYKIDAKSNTCMMLNSANWVPIWRTQSRDYNGTATVRILEILEESESREWRGGVEILQTRNILA